VTKPGGGRTGLRHREVVGGRGREGLRIFFFAAAFFAGAFFAASFLAAAFFAAVTVAPGSGHRFW
jgi:hypothetical protein